MRYKIYGSVEWQNSMDRMLGTLEAEAQAEEDEQRWAEVRRNEDGYEG